VRDASIRAWRFEPLPEIRTVALVVGRSCMVLTMLGEVLGQLRWFFNCSWNEISSTVLRAKLKGAELGSRGISRKFKL
jgi:hypothetical protein